MTALDSKLGNVAKIITAIYPKKKDSADHKTLLLPLFLEILLHITIEIIIHPGTRPIKYLCKSLVYINMQDITPMVPISNAIFFPIFIFILSVISGG